ncbi:MAG: serine acetyltransferase [Bacteroidaceae bacterium]|nr:serine acetyltransferase [Bacteroidaceae bacterium]
MDVTTYQSAFRRLPPSFRTVHRIVDMVRALVFPGFFRDAADISLCGMCESEMENQLRALLVEQIRIALAYEGRDDKDAESIACEFVRSIPELQEQMSLDVMATYDGDPASKSYGEIISCYPGIRAIVNYRMAHRLLLLGVPLIPRIITELAHSETGIDIHPGASIGSAFSIDHGTGVVIGETSIIGNHVKLYQGVTLGARSFPLDEHGHPIKDLLRHPIISDNVIVYSNASILGRVKIGEGATIGGNLWVTEDVPAGAVLVQADRKSLAGKRKESDDAPKE